jgi:hypothetical protein
MLKNLVKIAQELDKAGFKKESDIVDLIIKRVASQLDDDTDSDAGYATEEDIEALLEGADEPLSEEEIEDLNRYQAEEFGEEEPSEEDIEEWESREELAGRRPPRWSQSE